MLVIGARFGTTDPTGLVCKVYVSHHEKKTSPLASHNHIWNEEFTLYAIIIFNSFQNSNVFHNELSDTLGLRIVKPGSGLHHDKVVAENMKIKMTLYVLTRNTSETWYKLTCPKDPTKTYDILLRIRASRTAVHRAF